jgi:hypothetical protein
VQHGPCLMRDGRVQCAPQVKKVADGCYPKAQFAYGGLLRAGDGVKRDTEAAVCDCLIAAHQRGRRMQAS